MVTTEICDFCSAEQLEPMARFSVEQRQPRPSEKPRTFVFCNSCIPDALGEEEQTARAKELFVEIVDRADRPGASTGAPIGHA